MVVWVVAMVLSESLALSRVRGKYYPYYPYYPEIREIYIIIKISVIVFSDTRFFIFLYVYIYLC